MVVVVVETADGRPTQPSLEAVAAGQALGGPVAVVAVGADPAPLAAALGHADVGSVVALRHDLLQTYTPDGFIGALAAFVAGTSPEWLLFPHTYQARDYVPALAARLGSPLATDCTAVKGAGGRVILSRPMFRGKVTADVLLQGRRPFLVTVQVGAFRADGMRAGTGPADVRSEAVALDPAAIRQRPEPPFREATLAVDLTQARRIVAVGRGIKDRDRLPVAETLADALGAELAASRPICDAGWLPMDRQVGSSGQTVGPDLYIALGISGAIQHIVGMRGSRVVVAINTDPEAPIFEVADYGVVGDLFEVVPALVSALK